VITTFFFLTGGNGIPKTIYFDHKLNIRRNYIPNVWNSQKSGISNKKVVDVLTSTHRKDMQAGTMKQEAPSVRGGVVH
jgi:hypothetical protein